MPLFEKSFLSRVRQQSPKDLLQGFGSDLKFLLKNYQEQHKARARGPRLRAWAEDYEIAAARAKAAEELAALKAELLADLATFQNVLKVAKAEALKDLTEKLARKAPASTQEALLREIQEQRAWARVAPQVAGMPAVEVFDLGLRLAKDALASGDESLFYALRVEIPAALRVLGGQEALETGFLLETDRFLAARSPEAAKVLALREEVETGAYQLGIAFANLAYGIEQGEASVILPGWRKGEVSEVALEAA